MITVRKLKLTIVGDEQTRKEQYKIIRDEQYQQYKALNLCMTLLNTHNILNSYNTGAENKLNSQIEKCDKKIEKNKIELKKENLKELKIEKLNNSILELTKEKEKLQQEYLVATKYRSNIDEKIKDMYIKNMHIVVQNQVNFKYKDMMSLVTRRVNKDFKIALKNGMARGERSLTNYKRDFPLMSRGEEWLKFEYDEKSDDIYINWLHSIKFKVILGYKKNENSIELRHTLHKVINKEYKLCNSSMQFDRNNNLILNLTLDIPTNENNEYIEGRTLGVDLGIKYPAYICLSDDTYKRKAIGCAEDFIRVREQIRGRRYRLQKQLSMVKGGKGRDKKLQALNRISDVERNFVKTYNHMISKNIVKFAKQHKCEYINLEKLAKDGFPNMILSKWSYYELQNMIEYKSNREGIKVRYIDPAYTSQTCSKCSHIDKENRINQEKFKCVKCGFELNADHNASINISRSNKYLK